MKNIIQYGTKRLDHTNSTEVDIDSGEIVPIDSNKTLIAISSKEIKPGEKGPLVRGVIVNVPKVASGEITKGAQFKIGTAGNTVEAVTAGETALVRNAFAYAAAGDGTEEIDIIVD